MKSNVQQLRSIDAVSWIIGNVNEFGDKKIAHNAKLQDGMKAFWFIKFANFSHPKNVFFFLYPKHK